MSEENVEAVLRAYEAWNQGDYDAVIRSIDPGVDWGFEGATRFPGTESSYHGHEGVREFWRIFVEPWEEFSIEIESARSAGDDLIVVFVVFHGKVREGLELETPFVHLLWMKDGKVVRLRSYDDRDEALKAAGLSE